MPASLVLTNGRIYTMDSTRPQAQAIALQGDKIMAVGGNDEMKSLLGQGGEWVDLGGRFVTPGLVDAHVHFQHFALSLRNVDLDGAPTRQAALTRIASFIAQNPESGWLRGRGWSQDAWPDRAFPTAADLDAIVPDRPVYLSHKSGHAAWVNSAALKLAHVNETTPDPPGRSNPARRRRPADGHFLRRCHGPRGESHPPPYHR
jgi:predicted amidohydrolase YtcJ